MKETSTAHTHDKQLKHDTYNSCLRYFQSYRQYIISWHADHSCLPYFSNHTVNTEQTLGCNGKDTPIKTSEQLRQHEGQNPIYLWLSHQNAKKKKKPFSAIH